MAASVVGAALKMTLGLFWNKARSTLSENLKDGDLNSQKLRSLIVSNMEDIKTKLDGLARCHLLSSASFIQQGLILLNDLLDKFKPRESTLPKIEELYGGCACPTFDDLFEELIVCTFLDIKNRLTRSDNEESVIWTNPEDFNFDVDLARKLIKAIYDLKMISPRYFKTAMKCFEDAHTRATDAFFNESLSLQDRIMAAKLRVQSRLLLSLEDPSLAKVCKVYLKELHGLPAVMKFFRYDLEGGVLSHFNKAERHELVQSVAIINFVLFRYLNCFTKELVNVYDWPLIEDEDWIYNPLIPNEKMINELQRAEVDVPNLVLLKPMELKLTGMDPKLVAVNIDRDLILFRQRTNPDVCELLRISGNEVNVLHTFSEFTLVSFLVIGHDNVVYVFADNVQDGVSTSQMMYDVFAFNLYQHCHKVHKHILLPDGSIMLAASAASRKHRVPLFITHKILSEEKIPSIEKIPGKENIRDEEKIPGEVNIRDEEKIPGKVNVQDEESIKGEVNIRSVEKIQGEVDIRSKEKIPGEVNIRGEENTQGGVNIQSKEKVPGEVNIRIEEKIPEEENIQSEEKISGKVNIRIKETVPDEVNLRVEGKIFKVRWEKKLNCFLLEIDMWDSSLATITDKHEVIAIEQSGYLVRVFEIGGQFIREFELHEGERETCVGITFNYLTKEVVVVSRVESGYFLSTYLPETGERRHHVRLSHLDKDCPASDIQLTSHKSGSMALISKEHVLYLQ